MDITNKTLQESTVNKPEMEMVENEKSEYKLLNTYLRRKGLKLYAYNPITTELYEVKTTLKESININTDNYGNLIPVDTGFEEANVDSRCIHFEALNWKNAFKRLQRYKQGKIKELCNLREPGNGIKLW